MARVEDATTPATWSKVTTLSVLGQREMYAGFLHLRSVFGLRNVAPLELGLQPTEASLESRPCVVRSAARREGQATRQLFASAFDCGRRQQHLP